DRVVADARGACGRGCRGGVLAVVSTADQRLRRERVVGRELDSLVLETAGNDLHARALEDTELRVAVGLERPVPVEVIRFEVEENGDVAGELVDVLELEARQLTHDPRRGRKHAVERRQRTPDVAGNLDRLSRRAEDRAEQLGR